ncbi:MAG: hypothetical protein ACLFS9_07800, partial [Nitriliruptoraceae bacterium]
GRCTVRTHHRAHRIRVVDRFGLVACPRERRDVPVTSCLACRQLLEVVRDEEGDPVQIRCRAADDVDGPGPPAHPFALLGPLGPWR